MLLGFNNDGRVNSISFGKAENEASFGIGISVISKDLLLKLISEAEDEGLTSFAREVLAQKINELKAILSSSPLTIS